MLDVRPLVDQAPFAQQIERRVMESGRFSACFGHRSVKLCQVTAGKVIGDICC
jgi:hypothetical protein